MDLIPSPRFRSPPMDRFLEIDAVRGLAIVMMVAYHALFDLSFTGVAEIPVTTGFWKGFQLVTATLFLGIAGVALSLSAARARGRLDEKAFLRKFLRRGAGIVAAGMVVTAVTLVCIPRAPVLFGVLHCIGVSILLSPLFFRFRRLLPVAGAGVILLGVLAFPIEGPALLLPLGVYPPGFSSVDWVPLFPWMGVVMLGIALGDRLYPGGSRAFPVPPALPGITGPAAWLGRHSLLLYFLHQPLILALFALLIPGFGQALSAALAG